VVVASTSEVVGERRQTTGNGIGGNDPNVPLVRRKTAHLVLTGPIPLASRRGEHAHALGEPVLDGPSDVILTRKLLRAVRHTQD
jgi:hypothetical protein